MAVLTPSPILYPFLFFAYILIYSTHSQCHVRCRRFCPSENFFIFRIFLLFVDSFGETILLSLLAHLSRPSPIRRLKCLYFPEIF